VPGERGGKRSSDQGREHQQDQQAESENRGRIAAQPPQRDRPQAGRASGGRLTGIEVGPMVDGHLGPRRHAPNAHPAIGITSLGRDPAAYFVAATLPDATLVCQYLRTSCYLDHLTSEVRKHQRNLVITEFVRTNS
jgi:hypothetical protein